jgi:hypothetical protein
VIAAWQLLLLLLPHLPLLVAIGVAAKDGIRMVQGHARNAGKADIIGRVAAPILIVCSICIQVML